MTKIQKKVEKFLADPASIKYIDLVNILIYYGFVKIKAKGSHMKFKHPKLDSDLVIPVHNKECKNFYKIEAKKKIGRL